MHVIWMVINTVLLFFKDPSRDVISIKFYDQKSGCFQIDMIPALSGKSLK